MAEEIIDLTSEAPAAASAPATTPTPAPAPTESSTPAPQSNQTPAPAAPATPAYESARDFVSKALGWKADYADDESFLRASFAETQTLRRQLDEARQLAQHHLYLQQQQQPKPAAADKPDPLSRYKAPEFNPSWLTQVERTETGGIRLKEGADPSILPKLRAYQEYQAEAAQKMTSDPVGYFKDMIEHLTAEKAQAIFQEQFQKIQGEQYTNNFLKDNSGWLLQQDSQGRIVQNPATGQPMLTQAGGRFLHYMQEAERYGITNPAAQEAYATNGLKAELYAPAAQGKAAVDVGEQQKQALLAANNRGNRNGSMTPPESGGPPVQNQALSLKDRLMQLPDEVFAPVAASA